MTISCGAFILNGDKEVFLLGHMSNGKYWSIPKGQVETGENYAFCALREIWEETNLFYDIYDLNKLGRFAYLSTKQLVLYSIIDYDLLNKDYQCNSYFKNKTEKDIPEFDDFMLCPITDYDKYCNPSLINLIQKYNLFDKILTNIP